jgi:3-hydroxybutyryl-CoA dehydrogenase
MKKVTVVGAGTMGNGIAHVFAQFGRDVALVDVSAEQLDRAMRTIQKNLERQVTKGAIPAEAKDATLSRIHPSRTLDDAAGCELAIEAVAEDEAVKREVFTSLDAICPPAAILASNTSSISITAIAAATKRPAQVVGMHFMNPVPVMKLVELIRGQATSDAVSAAVKAEAEALGKTVVVAQDYPGFVSNRVLLPMINEAVYALMEGVSDRDGIDTVMKLGMNHPMGPLQLADFIGLDVCLHIMEVLHRGLGDAKYRPCPLLRRMVAAGQLGRKSGRGFYDYGEGA